MFRCAADYALDMPEADYWEMSHAAARAAPPRHVDGDLLEAYFLAINNSRPGQNVSFTLLHTCPVA